MIGMGTRTWVAALALVGLGAVGPPAAVAAVEPPSPVREVPGPVVDRSAGQGVLGGDAIRPDPDGLARWRVKLWPGSKIRYYESIPAKWQWGLDRAIWHWNTSGGDITFVKTSKARADLKISYGPTGGADGVGTLGHQRTNYVHLSTAYKNANEKDPQIRVWVGRLFTHELGHVLGFQHVNRGACKLMYPYYDFGVCPPLPDDQPGYYHCRWIDKGLLDRFIDWYGGRAQRPPRYCLIGPLPPQLQGVTFSGGGEQQVTVSWQPLVNAPSGTRLRVSVWEADTCADPPSFVDSYTPDPAAGAWTDKQKRPGSACYHVQVENRWGGTRPAFVQLLDGWAPSVGAPAVAYVGYDEGQGGHVFTWTPAPNLTLYVQHGPSPTECPSTFDESEAFAPTVTDGELLVPPGAPEECLSFFTVAEWRATSEATSIAVELPTPPAPTVGTITAGGWEWEFQTTVTVAGSSYDVGIEVLPGSCPATAPTEGVFWGDAYSTGEQDTYAFSAEAEGENCALFTAYDWQWDRHGPVVMRAFTAPPLG